MLTVYTIPAFILAIGILITVHEYGHYAMAKWCGVRVLRFSIGFGKTVFNYRFSKHGTEFVLALIPLGGYVKMLDERELEDSEKHQYSETDLNSAFNRQAVWKRMLIVIAGPLSNLLLAVFLYWILILHGVSGLKPIIGDVIQKTPAASASLKPGELIEKVNGEPVYLWSDIHWQILKYVFDQKQVTIEARNGLNELHVHTLKIDSLNEKDLEGDFLKKLGLEVYQPINPPVVGEVTNGGVADKAGILSGDRVISVEGFAIQRWEQFVEIIRKFPAKKVHIQLLRGNKIIDLTLVPESYNDGSTTIGRVGVSYHIDASLYNNFIVHRNYSSSESFRLAFEKTFETCQFTLSMLYKMLTGQLSWKSVSGPLTIADMAGKTANVGFLPFISFMAVISISLGVLNLLPIPVLDGGHLMYYTVELIKGSPVSVRVMEVGQRLGLSLLGLLMAVALFNDLNRFITG